MKSVFLSALIAIALSLSLISGEALAKRMGSGSDSGMQRSVSPTSPASASPTGNAAAATAAGGAATAAAGAATKSSWMGPIMGLAAGGLLAAAFMGGAFDGISPMDIVLILLIVGGIFFFLRRRAAAQQMQPATASASNYTPTQPSAPQSTTGDINIGSRVGSLTMQDALNTATPSAAPAWFDEKNFTTQAKSWFVQLQMAWDKKDYVTLGAIVTPELLVELRAQREQQIENNVTKVDEVFAQVVEFVQDAGKWILTVRFNGYLSEKEGDFPHAFSEYWHLVRIGDAQGEWKLAGIQQDK
jgi:predicted lipid-binding transport protein (Tim44 family)